MHPNSQRNHRSSIEKKWQLEWNKLQAFSTTSKGEKYYVLNMFPYPSGKLHVGHTRNYVIGDVIARYKRLSGYNVLHPMGWDAFGLPAENAAIEGGIMPWDWTSQNIKSMKEELVLLGLSYDWDREITTCNSSYYVHEQRLFIEMLQHGLAYKKHSLVNWDPIDQTVLADEQVVEGRGWRSGAPIEKRSMEQWFLKITDFAEDLLNDLDELPGIPEKVKLMQKNWIGKAQGTVIDFAVEELQGTLEVFSTRPETIFGCSFIAVSYDHPIARVCSKEGLSDFILECKRAELDCKSQAKLGFFTGLFASHPFDKSRQIPIFIANFVLMDYASGAVFGCPAHDERDYEFALKYSLPVVTVVEPPADYKALPYTSSGTMCNSSFLDGLTTDQARLKVVEKLKGLGKGRPKTTYRLRDWGISRQRFWGCPIPIIYCQGCGMAPVPQGQLPVELPEDVRFEGRGNPLDSHPTWKHVKCPKCGGPAQRETDTFDTFLESSWYFFRFVSPKSPTLVDPADCTYWMPVELCIGGIEHAIQHCLYARFITKVLNKLGYCKVREPFCRLLNQGMVLHHVFKDEMGKYVYPQDAQKAGGTFLHKGTGLPIVQSAKLEKMSKSKKNVVSLKETVEAYGADTVRLAVTSDTPPERDLEWSAEGIEGCSRFLDKLYATAQTIKSLDKAAEKSNADSQLALLLHQTISAVNKNLEECKLNKVIALLRELYNGIQDAIPRSPQSELLNAFRHLILMLNPFIPHITEEIWQELGQEKPIVQSKWPNVNKAILAKGQLHIAIQINGKYAGTIEVGSKENQEEVLKRVIKKLQLEEVKKVFFVPGKIISLVTKGSQPSPLQIS